MNDNNKMIQSKDEPQIKVYKQRWYILFLYMVYTGMGQLQWIEYSIIGNIVARYYNVSIAMVDWTAMVFMIAFPIFVLPGSYLIDKFGLRVAGLTGCILTAAGVWIKVFSVNQNSFYLVLLGQSLVGISQLVVLSLAPQLAVTWFPENEISRATALGVFGMQVGVAIGFILPSTLVKNSENIEEIGAGLKVLCWSLTAVITPVAIAMIFYFPKEPKFPPNKCRTDELEFTFVAFFQSLKKLFASWDFIIHLSAFSISVGAYTVIGSLLSQFVLDYFKNAEEDAGRMGLIMVLGGIIATPIIGLILDKTHAFKMSCAITIFWQALGMALLIFALQIRMKWLVYIAFGILGIFLNTYIPAAIEFAMEITYPSTESTTTGILYAVSQTLGFLWTLSTAEIVKRYGTAWAMASIVIIIVFGVVLTICTPNNLKRQANFKAQNLGTFKPIPNKEFI